MWYNASERMPEPLTKYASFDAVQLAADDFFQDWVRNPSGEADQFWDEFLHTYPERQTTMEEARQLVQRVEVRLPDMPEAKVQALKTRLEQTIGLPLSPQDAPVVPLRRSFVKRLSWVAAAVVLLVGGVVAAWYTSQPTTVSYATSYGETRKVELPDGSVVNLNANSTLSFSEDLKDKAIREVWLQGEAFFDVKHTPTDAKFRVHTNDLVVEVLGTEFNVSDRRKTTQVVLQSGKVQIKAAQQSAVLRPGDMVEFRADTRSLTQRKVRTELYSSWQQNIWILDGEAMSDVAQRIEDNFGIEVSFENPALANEKISGTIPSGSAEEVRDILVDLLKADCQLSEKKLTIK
ncbi:MAG TPA: hypothetical protein DCR35_14410 [Runella sp.]|nr:hypothetical protein [Runella sp.]HAO50379.1 hypothetical protein [Runella sp.]